ncbi:hypothetical protein [Robiginitomaculum antarcticum]|uniref:hypothetical protein n=1 Tax=Robiginitomaculum antarcticum TaxID=437507 RepID=UPI000370822D|nr:hypothetical protein [Robiginitomaculum antarcticum]
MRNIYKLMLTALILPALTGCGVAKATGKVAALPVKGVYYTGKYAGKGVIGTSKLAGKGVYYTGKGIYETGKTTVRVTNAVLETTANVLIVTTLVVDVSGKLVTLSKLISRAEMEAHIAAAKASGRVISILIDVARS